MSKKHSKPSGGSSIPRQNGGGREVPVRLTKGSSTPPSKLNVTMPPTKTPKEK